MSTADTRGGYRDAQERFHWQWLGMAQPIEGLVFSVPVLAEAQITPEYRPSTTREFVDALGSLEDDDAFVVRDLDGFFERYLKFDATKRVLRDGLPESLNFYAEEGRQEIRPSLAILRSPVKREAPLDDGLADLFDDDPSDSDAGTGVTRDIATEESAERFAMLVWHLPDDAGAAGVGLSLDAAEDVTGTWRYPPTAKFERLLRHVGVPLGLLSNGHHLRLVYAPAGQTTSHLTFRCEDMATPAGRPLLAAFELLLGARRAYTAAPENRLEGLLKQSRERQADVTHKLAEQVFEAVEILLRGFEVAARRNVGNITLPDDIDRRNADLARWMSAALAEPDDHLYQGILSVVLRVVFLLYSEDQSLLPVEHPVYARHLSVKGLFDELVDDAGAHPESMHHRFGAYDRLLTLFRAIFLGVEHRDLRLPPRRGELFDPNSFPFLEGGLPGDTAAVANARERAAVCSPRVDDGVIHDVLKRLVMFEGQRLSYRSLDVEQIGSVYESLMGYHVERFDSPAVRLGKLRVWTEASALRMQSGTDRKAHLKTQCGLTSKQIKNVSEALVEFDVDETLTEALLDMTPGRKASKHRNLAPAGQLVLQPGEERRRTGSHYTPRSLTRGIVARALEPVLLCLGETPTEQQILSLKVCDPAMGSGAFLVEACRQLADQLVLVWTRDGQLGRIQERYSDPHLYARRLVAQRCVYGVDKNRSAVELAKLSLWLITLSAELPFTFVDHALRWGDSLVGLDLDQFRRFHWKAGKQLPFAATLLDEALAAAIRNREAILELASREDVESQEEKRRLLTHADQSLARVQLIADVCVGAFFDGAKPNEREAERLRRLELVREWLEGDASIEKELQAMADGQRHRPFHWPLEFAEVFQPQRGDPLVSDSQGDGKARFDVVIGNPPFAGKNNITNASGSEYLSWLKQVHEGAHGNADLCAHFFRRAATVLGTHGSFGLIATNTISQGDTRSTGLQRLVRDGWALTAATLSMAWPGNAAVTVSVVHAAHGAARNRVESVLDGDAVPVINSRLRPVPERDDAARLSANKRMAFQGSIVLGMGFTLTPEERDVLVARNPANDERIFPYLGGEEVNTSPTQDFDRYVISFGQMSLEQAERWPDLLSIVREKVKPERDKNKRKVRRERWWQFAEPTPALAAAIAPLDQCLVSACAATKHLMFSFQPTDRVFSNALYVFAFDEFGVFSVLQSRIHEAWARLLSSSLKSDLRYAASDCFDTFPFPKSDPRTEIPAVESIGETLYNTRASYMRDTDKGLTKTYNALKDSACTEEPILALRTLHESLDRAVLDAYGWDDIEVPPFCPLNPDEELALEQFKDVVIDRLYLLNAERAREEERLGLGQTPTRRKAASRSKRGSSRQSTLELDDDEG